jgi:regulator of nucleoside diphosphate kinase
MSYLRQELPPITLSIGECDRLRRLVDAAEKSSPKTAAFLSREIERADIVDPDRLGRGLVTMGSEVEFRDDTTGKVRRVTLVYPNEADVGTGKISVLTPIGAALIGLSVGQSIEWELPTGGWRSLTVLDVLTMPPQPAVNAAVANPANP